MNEWIIVIGLLTPFIGTCLGSSLAFFMKKELSPKIQKLLLGFTAGIMVAASIWSLLIPAIDMSLGIKWLPPLVGFLLGIFFLLLLDHIIPHLHIEKSEPEGPKTKLKKSAMLALAVTLHNIPEGMAVGTILIGLIAGSDITIYAAIALTIGVAIQNIPEGAIISMPMRNAGSSRRKACLYGILSGFVEPVAGFITIMFASLAVPVLPYLLAFAAGAMIYVVTEELIPSSQYGKHTDIGTIGLALGFALMMVLDVALG